MKLKESQLCAKLEGQERNCEEMRDQQCGPGSAEKVLLKNPSFFRRMLS
jgi:hypothetical protein